ncbi:MAG TPA: hypothetical protein VFF52_11865 [Isosphaeraceae bacterium]|nr:hypothetical protein [Isosphaeraceae bacterium]
MVLGLSAAMGQSLANPLIDDFEIAPGGAYEWDLLGRLWVLGNYEPADLARLSRLTVLESIAMYQNMRTDLRLTMIGARLEGEMSALWDAAALFYVGAGEPMDFASVTRSRILMADLGEAYRQVTVTLGTVPGLSLRAAYHLQDISRLLPTMNDVLDAIETDLVGPSAPPAVRTPDLAAVREAVRRLIQDLSALIQRLRAANVAPAERNGVIDDLNGLLDLLRGVDRMLSAEPSFRDLVRALRLIGGRVWPVETRMARLAGGADLSRRWRLVRQGINDLSDEFGLPRVLNLAAATRPAGGVDRNLMAQVDRAIAGLDRFLSAGGAGPAEGAEGSQFRSDAAALRRKLLLFRQYVAANTPAGQLMTLLRDIEAANRQLNNRARFERRIDRGGSRLDTREFQEPAQAVDQLRDLLPRPAANAPRATP